MNLDWKRIVIDSLIIFLLTFIGGFVVGLIAGSRGTTVNFTVLGLSNLVLATAGFAFAAYRKQEGRWPHLLALAIIFWLTGLINLVTNFSSLNTWLISIVPSFVFMGIGGGIAVALHKLRS